MNRPASLTPPPRRSVDGLAADTPVQPRPTRWFLHPGARLLWFILLAVAFSLNSAGVILAAQLRPDGMLAGSMLQLVITVAAYLALTLLVERRRPPYELAGTRIGGLGLGLALGALLFLACFATITALGGYRFEGLDAGYQWAVPLLVLGVGAGVSEELLFRGVLFRLVEEMLGTWAAAGISGAIFGLLHLGNPDASLTGAIAIAVEAGLMFAFLYALTRSLWFVIGVHAAWNIVQGPVLGVPVSGSGFSDGWLNTVAVGPDWLTGGSFGAESSLVTIVLLVAFTAWLGVLLARSGQVVAPRWVRRRTMPTPTEPVAVEGSTTGSL